MDSELANVSAKARRSLSSQNKLNLKLVGSGDPVNAQTSGPHSSKGSGGIDQKATTDLESSVDRLRGHLQSIRRDLQFSIDQGSGDIVISVLNTETEQVIRQIPTEEVLALARNIESMKGVLFSAEV